MLPAGGQEQRATAGACRGGTAAREGPGGREPLSGAGSFPRAVRPRLPSCTGGSQRSPCSARVAAALPPACPAGAPRCRQAPGGSPSSHPPAAGRPRWPLLPPFDAPACGSRAAPVDKLPALIAKREASGSSPALYRASLCVTERDPSGAARLRWPSAPSGAARRLLLPSCGLHPAVLVTPDGAARKPGISPPKTLRRKSPHLVVKPTLGCEAWEKG